MIRVIGFAARKIDDRYMRKRASRFTARESMNVKEEKRRDRRRVMKKISLSIYLRHVLARTRERRDKTDRSVERPLFSNIAMDMNRYLQIFSTMYNIGQKYCII